MDGAQPARRFLPSLPSLPNLSLMRGPGAKGGGEAGAEGVAQEPTPVEGELQVGTRLPGGLHAARLRHSGCIRRPGCQPSSSLCCAKFACWTVLHRQLALRQLALPSLP